MLCTPGGGGYGAPHERQPELVRQDVADELIDAQAAEQTYGVVLDGAGVIDADATRLKREEMSHAAT